MAHENPVPQALRIMRAMHAQGGTWEDAARRLRRNHPSLFADVMDWIGSYPSSEPELRAVQHVEGVGRDPSMKKTKKRKGFGSHYYRERRVGAENDARLHSRTTGQPWIVTYNPRNKGYHPYSVEGVRRAPFGEPHHLVSVWRGGERSSESLDWPYGRVIRSRAREARTTRRDCVGIHTHSDLGRQLLARTKAGSRDPRRARASSRDPQLVRFDVTFRPRPRAKDTIHWVRFHDPRTARAAIRQVVEREYPDASGLRIVQGAEYARDGRRRARGRS